MKKTDPLIQALLDCETRLRAWINESALNADLFRRDPLTAIRTANVGVDERLLSEFEETVTRIALKLDVR
jgi:predicted component of type VI protein secretion system